MQCHNRRNSTLNFANTSTYHFHLYTRYSKIAEILDEKKFKVKEYLTKSLIGFDEELGSSKEKEVQNSISRFEKTNKYEVNIGNPKVVKTKGSGNRGRRPKSDSNR